MQSSVVCYYAWSLLGSSCTSYLPVFPSLLVWCWWEWPHYSSRDWVTHEGSGRGCARVQDPWHDPGSGSWWKWNCRVQWVFGGRLLGEAVFQYCTSTGANWFLYARVSCTLKTEALQNSSCQVGLMYIPIHILVLAGYHNYMFLPFMEQHVWQEFSISCVCVQVLLSEPSSV